jgi:hypothetical protein
VNTDRLAHADQRTGRVYRLDCIYHTNVDLLLDVLKGHDRENVAEVRALVDRGRLRSVASLLREMASEYGGQP